MKKLRIAQVGTIWEKTPPKLYGGTERIVYNLTEELVKRGHKVSLFATGDSLTSGELKSTYPRAAYRDKIPWENFLYPLDHISNVFLNADRYDLIHVHLNRSQDYAALVFAALINVPVIFTIHFTLPTAIEMARKDRYLFLSKYKNRNYVSISKAQRVMDLNFIANVYNGLDFKEYKFNEKNQGQDLVWIGRFCHEKGPKEAIEVAKRTGMNLILAGKIDRSKKEYAEYFDKKIAKHIDGKQIKYIGEVNEKQKIALLKKAKVLLMPINWNEPFGLTTIEAMAAGVPVIAFDQGPMREIIMDGKTGFVVKNVKEMSAAVKKVQNLNRQLISQYAKSHFSAAVMTDNYLKVYEKAIKENKRKKQK